MPFLVVPGTMLGAGGGGPAPPPTGPNSSVLLNGSNEYFARDPKVANGISSAISLSVWFKAAALPVAEMRLLSLAKDSGLVADGGNMLHLSLLSSGTLKLKTRTNLAAVAKDWRWAALAPASWYHFALTLTGGGTLTTYVNGAARVPDSTPTNNSWTLGNSARVLYYGQSAALTAGEYWDGNLGHLAFWGNRVLSAASVAAIYAGKHGLDLRAASGSYSATDASNLDHYFRPGFADEGFADEGVDFGNFDLDQSVGIDSSNIVGDAP